MSSKAGAGTSVTDGKTVLYWLRGDDPDGFACCKEIEITEDERGDELRSGVPSPDLAPTLEEVSSSLSFSSAVVSASSSASSWMGCAASALNLKVRANPFHAVQPQYASK